MVTAYAAWYVRASSRGRTWMPSSIGDSVAIGHARPPDDASSVTVADSWPCTHRAVASSVGGKFLIADLPFLS